MLPRKCLTNPGAGSTSKAATLSDLSDLRPALQGRADHRRTNHQRQLFQHFITIKKTPMTEKEDYIHNDPSPWRDKAIELLAKIKAERAGKEFVRIPLETGRGYYEIEKSKYEKRQRQK
nr:MAG TPA: hypothetical protein [Caudoviricetes sp.]